MIQERYGAPADALRVGEARRPEPLSSEILIRVRAAAIAGDDWHLMRGEPYIARLELGMRRPKERIPGRDVAGVVVSCGSDVRDVQAGDEVFGWCAGAFAEYALGSPETLIRKPSLVGFEEAAAVPTTGVTALQALRDAGELASGQRVLIVGASGGVGTLAVQIGASLGADVTAVCSGRNAELVRSLGAAHVVDYTREDFTRSGRSYDVIIYLAGNRTVSECRRALEPAGRLVLVGGAGGRWLGGVARWLSALTVAPFTRQKLRPFVHSKEAADLTALRVLLETGQVRPLISVTYPVDDVLGAIAHFREGHGTGKVVLRFPEEE